MKTLFYVFSIIIFLIAAFFITAYASGYKFDIRKGNISQTVMLVVETDGYNIDLDGKFIGKDKVTLRDLKPGEYQIRIYKEGYQDWTRKVELSPGQAGIINDAILFKSSPAVSEYSLDDKSFFTKISDRDGLSVQDHEIIQNGNFVTRFAREVKGVSWYPDRRYIAYTYENKLKIIEIDGTNEIILVDKTSDSPAVFINSGRSVIYENDGKVYKADIR
jgi:hypothetical protein